MRKEEQFEKAIGMLREADKDRGAPGSAEVRLRAAFRERHARRPPKRFALLVWAFAVVAFAVVSLNLWRISAPVAGEADRPLAKAAKPTESAKPSLVQPTARVAAPEEKRIEAVRHAPRVRRRVAKPLPQNIAALPRAIEEPEEFLAIPYAPPITATERGEVMRVQVPRLSLRSLGIPINVERLSERVPADVLMGEDGIARGIRLVRASEFR